MQSESFHRFLAEMREVEEMYNSFKIEEKQLVLKVFVSLCKRLEIQLGPSYTMMTCILYNTPDIEDFFSVVSSTPVNKVQDILEDLITSAMTCSHDKSFPWPSTGLEDRRACSKVMDELVPNDGDSFSAGEAEVDGSFSVPERKHKQKQSRKTPVEILNVCAKKRGRPAKSAKKIARKTKSKHVSDKIHPVEPLLLENSAETCVTFNPGVENRLRHLPGEKCAKENEKSNISTASSKATKQKSEIKLSVMLDQNTAQCTEMKRKRGRPRKQQFFNCKKCDRCFTHEQSLRSHSLEIHGQSPQSCPFCRKEFLGGIDTSHRCRKTVCKIGRNCKLCRDRFTDAVHFKKHTHRRCGKQILSFFCKFCDKGFVKQLSLFSHYKKHADGQYVCMRCGDFCKDYDNLAAHTQMHHKDVKYSCRRCRKQFDTELQYRYHLNTHKLHSCSLCQKSLPSHKGLAKHMLLEHKEPLEQKPYKCDTCGKMFARPGMLTVHMRLHTGERPVECGVCQLFFRTNKALAKHKQTYTHCLKAGETVKERRYLCQECGKAYFRKHALLRHMSYHSGEKPHMCQHCGYKCREANNLKRHMALHFEAQRNYICEICGSAFHAKKTLEMHHAYKHNEERNFSCPDCHLSFKAKNALRRHSKVHSVEKEHKCWCGTAFKRLYNLRRHLKSVHGTDEMLPPVRRVSTLDCSKKLPISKTDIVDKFSSNDTFLRDTSVVSASVVPCSDVIQPVEPGLNTSHPVTIVSSLAANTATPPGLPTTPLSLQAPPTPDTGTVLRFGTPLPVSFAASLSEPNLPINLQNQPTIDIQQLTNSSQGHQDNQPQTSGETTQTLTAEELADRLRYTQDNITYTNTNDPSDPFLQGNTSLGGGNIIPQAVAYSNIMREYGGQFPFLQDSTLYQYVK